MDRQSWKGKQLRRDLELSRESVEWVKDVRMGLENTRSQFVEYQANVGGFKVRDFLQPFPSSEVILTLCLSGFNRRGWWDTI